MAKQNKKKPVVIKKTTTGTNKQKEKPPKKPKKKNISREVKIGTTVQTRDEFFEGKKQYRKEGYEGDIKYRKAVVVDSNKKNELAVVKLTTSDTAKKIPNYQKGKSKFHPYIETKDDDFKPIKLGDKFERNSKRQNMSKKDVNTIKKESLLNTSKRLKEINKKRVRGLKGRKNKK